MHDVSIGGNAAGVRHQVGVPASHVCTTPECTLELTSKVKLLGQGTNLTMIGMHIHDNDDGILGGNADYLVFDGCLFEHNGWNAASGMAHNMYINHATRFTIRNSISRATKKGGHLLKSRAVETRVENCTIASLDGDTSREMDIPEGGIVNIRDSVLEKGPASENNEIIGYLMEEYDPKRNHSFSMTNTILIMDQPKGTLTFVAFKRPAADGLFIANNTFVGKATDSTSYGQKNTVFANRVAAGLQPYPALPANPAPQA